MLILMAMFFSLLNRPKNKGAAQIDGVSIEYQERFGSDGVPYLERARMHDLNAIVQASKDATNIYKILDRFALGDYSVLNRTKPMYSDVSSLPQNLLEIHDMMLRCDSKFNQLDPELRSQFGDLAGFASSVYDGSVSSKINTFVSKKNSEITKKNAAIDVKE